jgi:flagellar protein FliJ
VFKFPLQRILELKAKREQTLAVQLAEAREGADQARHERDRLAAERIEGGQQAAGPRNATAGERQTAALLLERLDWRLQSAREAARQAEANVARTLGAFSVASRERRILDRLRDRHLLGWQAAEVQADRKAMDSIALSRFKPTDGRPGSKDGGA